MKFLIVNDDSIHAPGIAMLAEAAAQLGDVWVVAPSEQCSAMSQKLTTHGTIKVERVDNFPVNVKAAYKVGGTPVDCVKVALYYLLKEKPDVVLSGINNGYNVGFDIAYSGTLGAAFEAIRNGIPAMAFSAAGDSCLHIAGTYLPEILAELLQTAPQSQCVWNVNFPSGKKKAVQGILRQRIAAPVSMYCEAYQDNMLPDGTIELTTRGRPVSDEDIPDGTDAKAVRDGYISIGSVKAF